MTFVDAIKSGFINYVNFKGRASRPAFWYWTLFYVLVLMVSGQIDRALGSNTAGNLVQIAFLLPNLSIGVRRFRDAGVNPWLQLLQVIPILVVIWFFVQLFAALYGLGLNPNDFLLAANSTDPAILETMTAVLNLVLLPLFAVVVASLGVAIFFLIIYVRPSIPDSSSSARTHNFGDTTA